MPVEISNPACNACTALAAEPPCTKICSKKPDTIPIIKAGIAGTFLATKTITPTGTSNSKGEITKLSSITFNVVKISSDFIETSANFLPKNPKTTSEIINAGIVV